MPRLIRAIDHYGVCTYRGPMDKTDYVATFGPCPECGAYVQWPGGNAGFLKEQR